MVLLHFRTPLGLGLGLTVKLSAAFFHDESSITLGWGGGGRGYKSAIVPNLFVPRTNI